MRRLLGVAVLGAIVQTGTATTGVDAATVPVERIAFVSDIDGHSDIYLVDPDDDTATATRITTDGQPKSDVALSPDGTRVAFVRGNRIWTKPVFGGEATRLTTTERREGEPAWSPDGRHIVFTRDYGSRRSDLDLVIRLVGGTDASEVQLARAGDQRSPDWAGSGDRPLVFAEPDWNGTSQLWRMALDGTGAEALTSHRNPSTEPTWSPSGTHIAFIRWHGGKIGMALMTLDVSNKLETRLGAGNQDFGPTWSPRGDAIAYLHQERTSSLVHTIRVEGGATPQPLHGQAGTSGRPDWGFVLVERHDSGATCDLPDVLCALK